jgi:hypothetical protein
MNPQTKHGYLKLLQTTAIRERMTNRWSLRRMMGVPMKENSERKVQACGTDLVSYRLDGPTNVAGMENYSSLWQLDRFTDFEALIPKVAPALLGHPLLSDEAYVNLVLSYISSFDEYTPFLVNNFYGDSATLVEKIREAQGPDMKRIEDASVEASADELLRTYNLPADDLSPEWIAERTAWRAYELRKHFLADSLVTLGGLIGFNSVTGAKAMKLADDVVDAAVKGREQSWRKAQSAALLSAVRGNWNLKFISSRNSARALEFERKVLPIAATGARGVQIQLAVESAMKRIKEAVKKRDPKFTSNDRTKPEYYTGANLDRISYLKLGLKDRVVPVTPDQLSRLFYRKLELLADGDAPRAERTAVLKVAQNKAVMKYMELFFADVAGQYQEALDRKPTAPAPIKNEESCSPLLGCGSNSASEKVARGLAAGEGAPQTLRDVEIDETNTPLESLLVPAAKKAMADFQKALETSAKYNAPKIEEGAVVGGTSPSRDRIREKYARLNTIREFPTRAVVDRTAVAKPYIPDLAKAMATENFYVSDTAQRAKAKELMEEAFAMIGLSVAGVGADPSKGFEHKQTGGYSGGVGMPSAPKRDYWIVSNLRGVERVVQMQMPKATLLEKIAGSALDQKILGNIVENDAYARAPMLAMQDSSGSVQDKEPEGRYNRFVNGTYFVPSMLRSGVKYFDKNRKTDNGWDVPNIRNTFQMHLYRAGANDVGKVEDFCEADLRDYGNDDKFKNMFKSITGLRDAFGSQGAAREWDEQITKDIRSKSQALLEDYIDPISMYLFVAVLLVMAWQLAPLILGFFSAAGAATTVGGALAAAGEMIGAFAKISMLLAVGNASPLMVLFTTQSILMGSVFCYQLPPQLDYAFQVTNSQITSDRVLLANREKLQNTREELTSSRMWARFAVGMEVFQLGVFTAPGVYRTLGFKGTRLIGKLTKDIDPELAKRIANESLDKLVKENGVRKGLALYSERIKVAIQNLDRASAVKEGAKASDLTEVMVQRAAPRFTDANLLRKIYGVTAEFDEVTKELKFVSTGYLKNVESQITKQRELITELQKAAGEIKKSSQWAEARAYIRNLKYKYGEDAKYFRLIVAKDYDEAAQALAAGVRPENASGMADAVGSAKALKQVMTGKNAKEIQILVEFAKLRDLEYKAGLLRKYGKILNGVKGDRLPLEVVQKHLRAFTLEDWQANQSLILDAVRRPLTKAESALKWKALLGFKTSARAYEAQVPKAFFKDLYKGFDYITQDYKSLNPKLVTLSKGVKNGVADLSIDRLGHENAIDPNDIIANPEDYEFLTIHLDDL